MRRCDGSQARAWTNPKAVLPAPNAEETASRRSSKGRSEAVAEKLLLAFWLLEVIAFLLAFALSCREKKEGA
jgi:hypothetical protein